MPAVKSAITVEFPKELVRETDSSAKAAGINRSRFIRAAVQEKIRQARRHLIDRQFEQMASDEHYRKLHEDLTAEFRTSDIETLR